MNNCSTLLALKNLLEKWVIIEEKYITCSFEHFKNPVRIFNIVPLKGKDHL